jgi:hypothetical protein
MTADEMVHGRLRPQRLAGMGDRARAVYQHNARVRQLLREPGNGGRDWLRAFRRHYGPKNTLPL